MGGVVVETLREAELPAFRAFCEAAWGEPHALIHNETMFEYYYRAPDGSLRFAVAKDAATGDFLSVCGYIPANSCVSPDIWISFIASKKGAAPALSLRLLEFIRTTTGCRTIACNNIRAKTRAIYEFFGYTVAEMTHYYRVNDSLRDYTICRIAAPVSLPIEPASLTFARLTDPTQLRQFDFEGTHEDKPYKDRAYVQKRFFENRWFDYEIYAACEHGDPVALLVLRIVRCADASAVRVVDFYGDSAYIPACGGVLDRLMRETGAEFVDWYAYGIDDALMLRAGLTARRADDVNIIPCYLDPPLFENTDYTLFTSEAVGYRVFRADGDQDRPNLGQ